MGILYSDGNTVSCCENSGVKDQSGNELRLCSAIDKEKIQTDKSEKCTTVDAYRKLVTGCKYQDCRDKVSINSQYCHIERFGQTISQSDGRVFYTYDDFVVCQAYQECLKYTCNNESYKYSMTKSCPAYPYPEVNEFNFILYPEMYKSWEQSKKNSGATYDLIDSQKIESSGMFIGLICSYKSCDYR